MGGAATAEVDKEAQWVFVVHPPQSNGQALTAAVGDQIEAVGPLVGYLRDPAPAAQQALIRRFVISEVAVRGERGDCLRTGRIVDDGLELEGIEIHPVDVAELPDMGALAFYVPA